MRSISLLLILVVVANGFGCGRSDPPTGATTASTRAGAEEQAIADIGNCGGTFTREGDAADGAVVEVTFGHKADRSQAVDDAGLEHFEALSELRMLHIWDGINVTDAGVAHLKGLKMLKDLYLNNGKMSDAGLEYLEGLDQLQYLNLANTQVGDAGLKFVKGLNQLQILNLARTKVSDAGLENLKGLDELKELYVDHTDVTDAGAKKLQEALPKCKIIR